MTHKKDSRIKTLPKDYQRFDTLIDAIKFHKSRGGTVSINIGEHIFIYLKRADWPGARTNNIHVTDQECEKILKLFP